MGVRKTSDGFTEYYDNKKDKFRLRQVFLDLLDNLIGYENGGCKEWVDGYTRGKDAMKHENIETCKKSLKRILDSKRK